MRAFSLILRTLDIVFFVAPYRTAIITDFLFNFTIAFQERMDFHKFNCSLWSNILFLRNHFVQFNC